MFAPDLQAYDFSDIIFHTGAGKGIGYKELAGNGFVLNATDVDIDGVLDGPYTKRVTIRHFVGGRIVDIRDVQATQGEFSCQLSLRRGRNTIGFLVEKEAQDELLIDVFCKSSAREWAENLVKALILVILVKTFVVQAFFIPTGSMEDTLFPGDYILVDKVSYLLTEPKRNDIIVFQYPKNFTQDFIKRLVGLPGDELRMKNKQLYRSGKKVDEKWVVNKDFRRYILGEWSIRDNWDTKKISDDCYFVMGDNRDYSQDSRFWGELPKFRLKGKAFLVYMPLRRFGLIRHGVHSEASSEPKKDELEKTE